MYPVLAYCYQNIPKNGKTAGTWLGTAVWVNCSTPGTSQVLQVLHRWECYAYLRYGENALTRVQEFINLVAEFDTKFSSHAHTKFRHSLDVRVRALVVRYIHVKKYNLDLSKAKTGIQDLSNLTKFSFTKTKFSNRAHFLDFVCNLWSFSRACLQSLSII